MMGSGLQILDYLLGHDDSALFRRSQLKALVSIHGKEAGGYLTHDETTIISGALDLTLKVSIAFDFHELLAQNSSFLVMNSSFVTFLFRRFLQIPLPHFNL
jgi:hypothetical protein